MIAALKLRRAVVRRFRAHWLEVEFGVDRLKLFLELNGTQSARKLLDATLAELAQWSAGREAEDDLTLLAIHFDQA